MSPAAAGAKANLPIDSDISMAGIKKGPYGGCNHDARGETQQSLLYQRFDFVF